MCGIAGVIGPNAKKAHLEVMFWTAGDSAPSAKYTNCSIQDGRNWTCPPNTDSGRTITGSMVHGRPAPNPGSPELAFHQIEKWKWVALNLGSPMFGEAMN